MNRTWISLRLLALIAALSCSAVDAGDAGAQEELFSAFGPLDKQSVKLLLAGDEAKIDGRLYALRGRIQQELARGLSADSLGSLSEPGLWRARADGAIEIYLFLDQVSPARTAALEGAGLEIVT